MRSSHRVATEGSRPAARTASRTVALLLARDEVEHRDYPRSSFDKVLVLICDVDVSPKYMSKSTRQPSGKGQPACLQASTGRSTDRNASWYGRGMMARSWSPSRRRTCTSHFDGIFDLAALRARLPGPVAEPGQKAQCRLRPLLEVVLSLSSRPILTIVQARFRRPSRSLH